MNDREMLELAAKAAGYAVVFNGDYCPKWKPSAKTGRIFWNPLADDGDALRLAVKLRLSIEHNHPADNDAWVSAMRCESMTGPMEDVDGEDYRAAATRRAIVRTAAEIARAADAGEKD